MSGDGAGDVAVGSGIAVGLGEGVGVSVGDGAGDVAVGSGTAVGLGEGVGVSVGDGAGDVAVGSGTAVGLGEGVGVSGGGDVRILAGLGVLVGSSAASDGGSSPHADSKVATTQPTSPIDTILRTGPRTTLATHEVNANWLPRS